MNNHVRMVRLQHWMDILQKAANSGIPKGTWCAQNGIPRRRFFYWQKKVQEYILSQQQSDLPLPADRERSGMSGLLSTKTPVFCELKPSSQLHGSYVEPTKSLSAGIMLQIGPYQVFVGNTADDHTLAMVLSVLRRA